MAFLIFWAYCGYLVSIYLLSLFGKKNNENQKIISFPHITLLVPCYNEEKLTKEKVENIKQLDYPKQKMKVYFLDGDSDDSTYEKLMEETKTYKYISVLNTNCQGKINQINFILPQVDTEIIVCTDMDALLEKNVLKEFIKTFQADDEVAVVGAKIIPENSSDLEAQYWESQNAVRLLESEVHSSSIVIAPCYAFKRSLLSSFPDDCIADDIYISFLANSQRQKVKYIAAAVVHETRTPTTLNQLITHKFRKGNAYQIELLRFVYTLPRMLPRWRLIFLTHFLQVIIMPWVLVFFALCSISLLLSGAIYLNVVGFNFILLFISLVITSFLMSRNRKKFSPGKTRKSILPVFLVTNFILLINGLTFPFYNQTSRYPKIESIKKKQ